MVVDGKLFHLAQQVVSFNVETGGRKQFQEFVDEFCSHLESNEEKTPGPWSEWRKVKTEHDKREIAIVFLAMMRSFGKTISAPDLLEVVDGSPTGAVRILAYCVSHIPPDMIDSIEDEILFQISRLLVQLGYASAKFNLTYSESFETFEERESCSFSGFEEPQTVRIETGIVKRTKEYANHLREVYQAVLHSGVLQMIYGKLKQKNRKRNLATIHNVIKAARNVVHSCKVFSQAERVCSDLAPLLSLSAPALLDVVEELLEDGLTRPSVKRMSEIQLFLYGASVCVLFSRNSFLAELCADRIYSLGDLLEDLLAHSYLLENEQIFMNLASLVVNGDCCCDDKFGFEREFSRVWRRFSAETKSQLSREWRDGYHRMMRPLLTQSESYLIFNSLLDSNMHQLDEEKDSSVETANLDTGMIHVTLE